MYSRVKYASIYLSLLLYVSHFWHGMMNVAVTSAMNYTQNVFLTILSRASSLLRSFRRIWSFFLLWLFPCLCLFLVVRYHMYAVICMRSSLTANTLHHHYWVASRLPSSTSRCANELTPTISTKKICQLESQKKKEFICGAWGVNFFVSR